LDNQDASNTSFRDIINEYLSYIEKQCRKAVEKTIPPTCGEAGEISIENEALELFNRVLDKLQANDFKILAQFKGDSKLSTYLSAIISRQAVDMIRQKRGRSREKERARAMGPLGEQIFKMVFQNGMTPQSVLEELVGQFGDRITLEKVETIVSKIKGRERLDHTGGDIQAGKMDPGTGQVQVTDPGQGPEEVVMAEVRRDNIQTAVGEVIKQLKGEERLLLRMRFPPGDNEPLEIDKISRILGVSPKAVYNRLSRLLKKCRDLMLKNGVNPDVLL